MKVYIVGFDPIEDKNGGVGGFNWFPKHATAILELLTNIQEGIYFNWFRELEVSDEMNRDDITEYIENAICEFGNDGDWNQDDKVVSELASDVAPEGYHAVLSENGCSGCAFTESDRCGMDRPCAACERKDNRNVIFLAD